MLENGRERFIWIKIMDKKEETNHCLVYKYYDEFQLRCQIGCNLKLKFKELEGSYVTVILPRNSVHQNKL